MWRTPTLRIIGFYQQYLRPLLPCACRFEPSCSEFTKQAIERYGFCKGLFKGAGRILSCHPFSGRSGWDPVK